jgi:hypothetical protein
VFLADWGSILVFLADGGSTLLLADWGGYFRYRCRPILILLLADLGSTLLADGGSIPEYFYRCRPIRREREVDTASFTTCFSSNFTTS